MAPAKVYKSGRSFFLSDHFGLLAFLNVHASYGSVGGGESEVARKRREVLGSLRTESVMGERILIRDRERMGEQARALLAEREKQKERGEQRRASARLRKERGEHLCKVREEVFGSGSLFSLPGPVPPPAADRVDVPVLVGCLCLPTARCGRNKCEVGIPL